MSNEIRIRAFFPAGNNIEAEQRVAPFLEYIRSKFKINKISLEPYWKMPEDYDLILVLEKKPGMLLSELTDAIGKNWSFEGNGTMAFLNNKTKGAFCFPYIRWMHIDMLEL